MLTEPLSPAPQGQAVVNALLDRRERRITDEDEGGAKAGLGERLR